MMFVNTGDDYDSLVHKIKAGIKYIINIFNPQYIIKCDF
jgi:hypothetical protein